VAAEADKVVTVVGVRYEHTVDAALSHSLTHALDAASEGIEAVKALGRGSLDLGRISLELYHREMTPFL
jgi:hypothetical protein